MDNNYYVYEWIRLDTDEPFYVGKGHGDRWKRLTRGNNQHFNNIVKSIPVAVNILHDNLEEQVANDLECYYIWQYRDIIGYNMCNINDGGEGNSMIGDKNPMFGKERTQEVKDAISIKAKERLSNKENHPMYGKHRPEETKKKIGEKASERYKGENNPRATSVICLTTKRIFLTTKDGAEYYGIKGKSNISACCKRKKSFKSAGKLPDGTPLVWRYLVWKHGKTYRLKEGIE